MLQGGLLYQIYDRNAYLGTFFEKSATLYSAQDKMILNLETITATHMICLNYPTLSKVLRLSAR